MQIPHDLEGAEEFLNDLVCQLNSESIREDAVAEKKNTFMQQAQAIKLRHELLHVVAWPAFACGMTCLTMCLKDVVCLT